ncbi:MAG TPA: DinB family protein, partial [Anaerolineales bacterium]
MDIQPETTLIELIHYNNWANAKVLAACQELTADQMAATAPGTYGSIRNTLGHIIRAEADYVGRMTGERPQPAFEWKDEPDLADVATF